MQEVKMVIVVRKDLNMRKGKMCSSVGHAVMGFLLANDDASDLNKLEVSLSPEEQLWFATGTRKIVVGCDSEEELNMLMLKAKIADIEAYKVTDSGHTEFHGEPTVTCAAFGPCDSDELNKLTGHLKLL